MRVLWVSDHPFATTGFGRVTYEVVSRLAKQPGVEVACLGWGSTGRPLPPSDWSVPIFSCASGFGESEFANALRCHHPSVVITLGELWMVEWLQRHPNRKEFSWVAYVPIDGGPFYPPWASILAHVDCVVAMSSFGRRILESGAFGGEVHCIPHGVDTRVFRPLPERNLLKSHERFRGKFVIGCVARNAARKNIPALVQAFAKAALQFKDLHLFLHMNPCDVGFDIVTLLHRYQLHGRADLSRPQFEGAASLSDTQLNQLYNLFDITVLSSMGEGFGLPILESLSAGVPVIATDYSACSELVEGHGELARVQCFLTMGTNLIEQAVVDVDDLAHCMVKLYQDQQRLIDFGLAGRQFAETLSWESLVPRWLEVIKLALAARE